MVADVQRTNSEQAVKRLRNEIVLHRAMATDDEDDAFTTDIETVLDEVERLRAGIWKMVGILGFDQDGAEHHHLAHPDIVEYGVQAAITTRQEYDLLLDATPGGSS